MSYRDQRYVITLLNKLALSASTPSRHLAKFRMVEGQQKRVTASALATSAAARNLSSSALPGLQADVM